MAEVEGWVGSQVWGPLTCISYKVNVKIISKRKFWLELKQLVEMHPARSVEREERKPKGAKVY